MPWHSKGSPSQPGPLSRKVVLFLSASILLSCFFIVLSSPVLAHPPSQMALEYDDDTQMLSVTITHSVPDPTSHYVEKVEITKNGAPLITEDYTSQPSTSALTYAIAADNGDDLEVTAYCSLSGSIREQMTVSTSSLSATPTAAEIPAATAQPSPTPGTSSTPTPESPGFEFVFALIGGCAALYLSKR